MTYKIIGQTNPWIANIDILFNGKTCVTIESNLTLKQAQKMLLQMLCTDYDTYFPNWGVAVNTQRVEAYPTRKDGTRAYEYDSRKYSIEEDND